MLCPMKLILSLRGTKTVFLSSPLRILLMNHFHSAGQWDLCTMNIFHWHLSLNCSSLQKMKGKGLDRLCSIQLARDSGRARLLVLGRGRGKLLRHISISLSHIPVELHQSNCMLFDTILPCPTWSHTNSIRLPSHTVLPLQVKYVVYVSNYLTL